MTITLRQAWVALRLLIVMTVLLGVVYPLAVWGVGRLVPGRADGSLVSDASGRVVGSTLIGQSFTGTEWFWPRPSAAGEGYDALASGGSNLAADNPALVDTIGKRKAAVVAADGVAAGSIPADAVTASGSGLDPDISPEYAHLQATRIAGARGISVDVVHALVDDHVIGRTLGFIGEPRVNVLELNLALEQLT
jgi:potassium-transporting ATPase KdpC subunit